MCFVPQHRALFEHLNFQKWSRNHMFCTFWLGHVLRATMACNCSSLIWPTGSAPAALANLLFDPPEPQIRKKTKWIVTFLPFRPPASSFFLPSLLWSSHFFSSPPWLFPPLRFHLSILSEVWLLNFLRLIILSNPKLITMISAEKNQRNHQVLTQRLKWADRGGSKPKARTSHGRAGTEW